MVMKGKMENICVHGSVSIDSGYFLYNKRKCIRLEFPVMENFIACFLMRGADAK